MADYSRLPGPVSAVWEWQQQGACRDVDPEVFFHPEGERGPSKETRDREAVAVCGTCPVIAECRRHALTVREPYGVWGGLTVEDRDLIVTRDRLTAAYTVPGPDPVVADVNHRCADVDRECAGVAAAGCRS